jgi:hypothetical protein
MWLSRGELTVETESEIIAAKYQLLQTKYNAENMKTETQDPEEKNTDSDMTERLLN